MDYDELGGVAQGDSADLQDGEPVPGSAEAVEISNARAEADREATYLAESGSISVDHRGRAPEAGKGGPNGRNTRNLQGMSAAEQAYLQAYNHKITINIGGEDVETTQGEVHDFLLEERRRLDERLRNARSPEERARIMEQMDRVDDMRQRFNPRNGTVVPPGAVEDFNDYVEAHPEAGERFDRFQAERAKTTYTVDGASVGDEPQVSLAAEAALFEQTESAINNAELADDGFSFLPEGSSVNAAFDDGGIQSDLALVSEFDHAQTLTEPAVVSEMALFDNAAFTDIAEIDTDQDIGFTTSAFQMAAADAVEIAEAPAVESTNDLGEPVNNNQGFNPTTLNFG